MTTQQVADRLVSLCREGKILEAGNELYADNIESIEPAHSMSPSASGKAAVQEKGKQFGAMIEEVHGGHCSKPLVAGNFFTCTMGMDVTLKGQPRMNMDEVAVYEVKDGKIVLEQFFF